METFQDGASRCKTDITSFEITLLGADAFYFWAREFDSRLVALHDFIIEQGFFIDVK